MLNMKTLRICKKRGFSEVKTIFLRHLHTQEYILSLNPGSLARAAWGRDRANTHLLKCNFDDKWKLVNENQIVSTNI